MKKFIEFVTVFLAITSVIACTPLQTGKPYSHPSPEIGSKVDPKKLSDPDWVEAKDRETLGTSVRVAGEVSIMVTFEYRAPYKRRSARTSDCNLSIRPSYASVYNSYRCEIEEYTNTFVVSYRDGRTKKRLDLAAIDGGFVGQVPWHFDYGWVRFTYRGKEKQNLLWRYDGPDLGPGLL